MTISWTKSRVKTQKIVKTYLLLDNHLLKTSTLTSNGRRTKFIIQIGLKSSLRGLIVKKYITKRSNYSNVKRSLKNFTINVKTIKE